jgi:hypothetical protein
VQLNAVVNGIQKKIGSKREPLVLLHHRRTKGGAAATPNALSLLNRWQNANCIYTTPTGSNDDWYVPNQTNTWQSCALILCVIWSLLHYFMCILMLLM